MATTLRIIEGPGKGTEFPITTIETIIGRGAKANVKVASPDASWEHAIITRVGEDWMIENLSAHGTWLNDGKISGRVRLRPRDRIRITDDTLFRFESTEGPQANVMTNPWVVRGIVGLVVLLIIAWGLHVVFQKPVAPPNWPNAHARLLEWLNVQVNERKMPLEIVTSFNDARQTETGLGADPAPTDANKTEYKKAAQRYERTLQLIDGLEDKYHCLANATEKPNVLWNKLMPLPKDAPLLDDDEMSACFAEFVKTKLEYCTLQAR